jgi:glycosyltransferase involved in cell wall biosynthesis
MRILQIVPSISLIYGGPSQMAIGLSKALAKEGIEVTLLTTDSNGDTGQEPLDVPLGQPVIENGYETIYFPCYPFRRYKFSPQLLSWLNANATQYDLAHIHALFSPFSSAAATLARYKHLPYILRPLGTLDPADLQKKKQLKQIYAWLLEKPNLAGAAALHFTSELEAKVSERFAIDTQDLVIPLGVDLPETLPRAGKIRQELGIPADRPLLLFMSRIDPKKGLDLLIPALEDLLKQGKEFYFALAGSNPQDPNYENSICQRIQESPLSKITKIVGFVGGETKIGLLQDADVFVLPSYYENFGIAVAEAMGVGTPIVISKQVYIWPEVESNDAGWICNCQVEDLTRELSLALKDARERDRKGVNAKNLVLNRYSWKAIAKQTIAAYEQILR